MSYLETKFDIKNKTVLITGGSGILGGKIAKGFLHSGALVILLDRNAEKLKSRVKSLKKFRNNVFGYSCDVLQEEILNSVNKQIISKFGRVDVLINAAGGQIAGTTLSKNQSVFDLPIKDFNKVTELNLVGTVLPTLIFGKSMAEQKSGSIINISSMASIRAITRVVGYSAAKAAVDNFTKWMAVEMALKYGDGIRVNAIAPGFFITNQNKKLLVNEKGKYTTRAKSIIKMTPFGRFGEPEELIGITLFLASSASKFITGTVIPVDGGFSVYSGV
ncbi:MAG: SDR family oxidoreductase [Ignavibacteriaceae bacterium]|nr:SDR family oxidoreductase [Ignavibacteriaceae bacterium]